MTPVKTRSTALLPALAAALLLACLAVPARAVPAHPRAAAVAQADGSTVTVRLRGDEYHHWHEDRDGYTILKDPAAKSWFYAEQAADGSLRPGSRRVGVAEPEKLGLKKGLRDAGRVKNGADRRRRDAAARRARASSSPFRVSAAPGSTPSAFSPSAAQPARAPILTGTMKNLVILARFSDHSATHSQPAFNNLFNQVGYNLDGAVGSVKDYFLEVSYGNLTVQSVVTVWVTLPQNQAYYGANDVNGNDIRPREMVRDAINALAATGFDFSQADGNGDGEVDGLTVIHSGFAEEYTDNPTDAIWSHQWELITPLTYNGVRMHAYHTEAEIRGWSDTPSSQGISRIGVICHETGHFLGLPDLYDTTYESNGVGSFCLMSGGSWNGADEDGASPSHLSAWARKSLGWATATQLTTIGTKSLGRIAADPAALYLLRDAAFPASEYFLIENRQGYGFDAYLPGSARGLLIWHIDEAVAGNDNPARYKVDLEEASGTQHLTGPYNSWITGDDADYYRSGNNTSFSDSTSPNSKSYAGQNLKLPISAVSASGPTMTFYLGTSDVTPPAAVAAVYDGLTTGSDISVTGSLTQLSANWPASAGDPETGLAGYYYAIGTAPGGTNVADWTANGLALSVTRSGLSLTPGQTYYFSVKAISGVGVYSAETRSNGQTVDTQSPSDVPYVHDGTEGDIDYVRSLTTLSAYWGESPSENIDRYEYAIGTTPGGTQTVGWTNVNLNTYVTRAGLSLAQATTYYFSVRARNIGGFYSTPTASDGQKTDTISPAARVEVVTALPARTGLFTARLIVTEANPLPAAPQLRFITSNGRAVPLSLTFLTGSTWTVSGYIESYLSTGTASFQFSAADAAGNTGTSITSGDTFTINYVLSGASGGSVYNSDGPGITLPPGAYVGNILLSVSTAPAAALAGPDAASPDSSKIYGYDLARDFSARTTAGAPVTTFAAPVTITLAYPDANDDGRIDMDLIDESRAWIYYLDPAAGRWTPVPGVTRDPGANTLSAQVSHFSIYSVRAAGDAGPGIGELRAYPNPCDLRVSSALTIDGVPVDATGTRAYIFNSAGELVRELTRSDGVSALNSVSWNGRDKSGARAASGLYIYVVKTDNRGKGSGKFFLVW